MHKQKELVRKKGQELGGRLLEELERLEAEENNNSVSGSVVGEPSVPAPVGDSNVGDPWQLEGFDFGAVDPFLPVDSGTGGIAREGAGNSGGA